MGNLTATISDHLLQFTKFPNMFDNISFNKYKSLDWPKFYGENFIRDYFYFNWEDLLKIDELHAEYSTKMCLGKINTVV